AQAGDCHVIHLAVVDHPDPAALAEASARPRVEVARAAPVAAARDQDVAGDAKCGRGHVFNPPAKTTITAAVPSARNKKLSAWASTATSGRRAGQFRRASM